MRPALVPGPVTGVVAGTAEYLAPERIAGAQAGPASDLYALGVVAYECLAGAPPFMGEPPDVACAHRDHPVPPLPGSVPAEVSALVMRLVAKDPAGRPGSAAEVARQAGRLRHGLRDDFSVGSGRTPGLLAAAVAVPPRAPLIAPAAVAGDARWQVPAARARVACADRRSPASSQASPGPCLRGDCGAHRYGAGRYRGCRVGRACGRSATICAAGASGRRDRSGPACSPAVLRQPKPRCPPWRQPRRCGHGAGSCQ